MPLRDHFRPPISKRSSWQGFHGGWPVEIVRQTIRVLPDSYIAEPRVHLGTFHKNDDCAFEDMSEEESAESFGSSPGDGGVATATWAPPAPTLTFETEFPDQYVYEVLIFDLERDRQLVAAIEIVSPANKDRPEHRQLFVAKCVNLLQKGVCVSILDLVTIRLFNLYLELLSLKKARPVAVPKNSPTIYAATCQPLTDNGKSRLETWSYPLAIGKPLPTGLPVWIAEDRAISVDLEASYEEACRVLRIR